MMPKIYPSEADDTYCDLAEGGSEPLHAAPKTTSIVVADYFTVYLTPKDESIKRAFNVFKMKEATFLPRALISVLWFTLHAFQTIRIFHHGNQLQFLVHIIAAMCGPMMFLYSYISMQDKYDFKAKVRSIDPVWLGNAIIVSMSTCIAVFTISLSATRCVENEILVCNKTYQEHHIPGILAFNSILGFLIMSIIFRCHDSLAAFYAGFVSAASLIISSKIVNAEVHTMRGYAAISVFVMFAVYDYEYNAAHSFLSFMHVEQAVRATIAAEQEKRVVTASADELRRFLGNVAHDLKTPLQAFMSELNNFEGTVLPEQNDSIELLKSTCHFMTMTINRSLDYVKCSSGFSLQPKNESISLKYCMEWVQKCIMQYVNRGINILISPLPKEIVDQVFTDKQWLLENLLCLISNAVKYVGANGVVHLSISIETEHNTLMKEEAVLTNQMLLFELQDNGIGIPEDKMKQLFKPFQQAQQNAGGTGLGLYALGKRVTAIGGRYGVCNRRDGGRGVLFWFTIPYRPDCLTQKYSEQKILPLSRAHSSNTSGCTSDTGLSILLVEDSKLIQKASTRMLSNMAQVDLADNGVECLEKISNKSYDLILMDINMPIMDGIECIRRMREDEEALAVDAVKSVAPRVVIGVSADSDDKTRRNALEAGMDGFVEKPLDIAQLRKECLSCGVNL